ncbi:RNA polymerase sigma factor [Gracilibacillus sp. S3-1-1]|uniref:RNA polymerase sigma factor n=1 Tax=Gracilibacillus pellucidus TaxID=3095368 RepID=A0ACC6M633_9BACI|nr:RNA polymerase sigma factor [Gracilibacillus sp. S3-1-1]MDX8046409.1 RNA polymerase sigma factor [Gracilibacillus sp. S3-1-1]
MWKKIFKKPEPVHDEFRLIYDMFYSRVYRDAFFITRDAHLAQDALQETFVKAYKHMDRLEDKERIGAWLSTIATRTAIDLLRKRKGTHEVLSDEVFLQNQDLEEVSLDPLDIVEGNIAKETLRQIMGELKAEYREVLLLHYIHELSIKEIVLLLDLNESTVKTRLYRGRKLIKEELTSNPKRQWIGGESC